MKIGEQELNLMQSLLKNKPHARELNKTLIKLNEEFGIGRIRFKEIFFDADCYRDMEQLYLKYAKCSYWKVRPKDVDRFDKAKSSLFEKSGGRAVFASQLQFASMTATLPLKNQPDVNALGVNGISFLIDKKHIDINRIKKLVVVENGTMLPHLYEWCDKLPNYWKDALFLYRGHESNSSSVIELMHELSSDAECAIFADFDLAGLVIIQSYSKIRPVYCVVPQGWENMTRNYGDNREDAFVKQYKMANRICASDKLQSYKQHILKHRLAVMQEQVLEFGCLQCDLV